MTKTNYTAHAQFTKAQAKTEFVRAEAFVAACRSLIGPPKTP